MIIRIELEEVSMPTFTMPAGLMNLMNPVVTNTMGVLQDAQRDLLDPFQTSVTVQQVSQQLFDTARGLESIPDVRPPWISPVVGFHQRITKDVPSELISPNLESIYSALSVRHKPSIFTEMETQKYFD